MSPYPDYKGQASPATIATGGPMGCGSGPCARAKPLAARYITHSKFNRAPFLDGACVHVREFGIDLLRPLWQHWAWPREPLSGYLAEIAMLASMERG